MIILSATILFSALDFPIRAFTALPIVLLYSFYTVSSFYPLPFDRRTSFLAVSRPITFILLMAFMFLSAVLSFSFVLFYTVLNFTYFIPLGCLPHLAFILLISFMFLSAALSFSFVLFSAVLNFTYFIPLGCRLPLAFIHPVFRPFLRLPPTFLRHSALLLCFSPLSPDFV